MWGILCSLAGELLNPWVISLYTFSLFLLHRRSLQKAVCKHSPLIPSITSLLRFLFKHLTPALILHVYSFLSSMVASPKHNTKNIRTKEKAIQRGERVRKIDRRSLWNNHSRGAPLKPACLPSLVTCTLKHAQCSKRQTIQRRHFIFELLGSSRPPH